MRRLIDGIDEPMTENKTARTAKSSQRKARNPFVGRWRITWMEQWDQEFVDEEVEGFFEFELQRQRLIPVWVCSRTDRLPSFNTRRKSVFGVFVGRER